MREITVIAATVTAYVAAQGEDAILVTPEQAADAATRDLLAVAVIRHTLGLPADAPVRLRNPGFGMREARIDKAMITVNDAAVTAIRRLVAAAEDAPLTRDQALDLLDAGEAQEARRYAAEHARPLSRGEAEYERNRRD